jgi:hypothetical protein
MKAEMAYAIAVSMGRSSAIQDRDAFRTRRRPKRSRTEAAQGWGDFVSKSVDNPDRDIAASCLVSMRPVGMSGLNVVAHWRAPGGPIEKSSDPFPAAQYREEQLCI